MMSMLYLLSLTVLASLASANPISKAPRDVVADPFAPGTYDWEGIYKFTDDHGDNTHEHVDFHLYLENSCSNTPFPGHVFLDNHTADATWDEILTDYRNFKGTVASATGTMTSRLGGFLSSAINVLAEVETGFIKPEDEVDPIFIAPPITGRNWTVQMNLLGGTAVGFSISASGGHGAYAVPDGDMLTGKESLVGAAFAAIVISFATQTINYLKGSYSLEFDDHTPRLVDVALHEVTLLVYQTLMDYAGNLLAPVIKAQTPLAANDINDGVNHIGAGKLQGLNPSTPPNYVDDEGFWAAENHPPKCAR